MSERIQVPHHDAQLQSGFLGQIWAAKEPLPRVTAPERVFAYVQRGFETVLALPVTNTVSIMTVAVSLFLFSGFLLVVKNVEQVLISAGSSLYLTAYVKDGAEQSAVDKVVQDLQSDPGVASVAFTNKDQALQAFRQDLGERAALLEGLEKENPLPASIDVTLKRANADALVQKLKAEAVIDEVAYGSDWFEKMKGVMRVFRLFGFTMSLIVLGIVIFLISNTIKLAMYSRRQEVEIMQLVGASDVMIKLPFLIGGAAQGLFGALLGVLFLHLSFFLVSRSLEGTALFGIAFPELVSLSPTVTAVVMLGGAFIGAIASLLALGRHMNI